MEAQFTGPTHARTKPQWYLPAAMGRPFRASTAELLEGLSHPAREVRLTAQRRLAKRKETGGLIKLLRDKSAPLYAHWHAIWALDAIDGGKAARKSIIQALNDPEPSIQRQAIRQVGSRRVADAVSGLLPKLKDADASIRFHAATALGRIADERAVPALSASLADTDLFARFAAFTALTRIDKTRSRAWTAIAEGLRSQQPSIREGTEFALRETYDEALLEVLARAIEGRQPIAQRWPTASREAALKLVAALHHKPPQWNGEWWAYHPALAPPPIKNVAWSGTEKVLIVLRRSIQATEPSLRLVGSKDCRQRGTQIPPGCCEGSSTASRTRTCSAKL